MADSCKIPYELLIRAFHYDPATGLFTWNERVSRKSQPGKQAGSTNKINGYTFLSAFKYKDYAHRWAWYYVYGEYPKHDIDHINGEKSDNRISNLRLCNRSLNMLNLKKPNKNNKSGYLGVYKLGNSYVARVMVNYEHIHLGCFKTAEEAHQKYLHEKEKIHEELSKNLRF